MIRITLDAGHYGRYNQSPAVPEYFESNMTWKLHLLLKEELEKYGIQVTTTRETQEKDLELYYRGYKAKGHDMFISLHSNAVGRSVNESIVHPIVYRLTSDNSGFADKLSETVESVMHTGAKPRTGTRLQSNGLEYYGVLRGAKAAGCTRAYIIEHSFHTATAPTKWLLDEGNLRKLAQAEAKAIAEYFGIKKEEDEPMTTEERKELDTLETKVSEIEKSVKVYHYWDEIKKEIPWAYAPLKALNDNGLFSGASASDLNVPLVMVRGLVCLAAALKTQGVIRY